MKKETNIKLINWIEDIQRNGRITFSLNEVYTHFSSRSKATLKNSLNRLVKKGKILSVWKGFYVIIPVEYSSKGIVPPVLYIDDLMRFLNRPYYVSLLSAAVFYGASHQWAQTFSVISTSGSLRNSIKKTIKINFTTKKEIANDLIIKKKTQFGYVSVSSPELTATDLIQYEKKIGGLNRAATVLNDLSNVLKFKKTPSSLFLQVPAPVFCRLGYLLEKELGFTKIANELFEKVYDYKTIFRKTPLKINKPTVNCITDKKWNVIVNEQIDIDE